MICLFFAVRAELCTFLMFSSEDLIHTGLFYFLGNSSGDRAHASVACGLLSAVFSYISVDFTAFMLTKLISHIDLNEDTGSVS